MEETFLHLWDEWDDLIGVCRHLASSLASETVAAVAPLIVTASSSLLAGAATLVLAHRHLLNLAG